MIKDLSVAYMNKKFKIFSGNLKIFRGTFEIK